MTKKIKKVRISSAAQMKRFGASVAKAVMKDPQKNRAHVIALVGELGSGKTTFTQGFMSAFSKRHRVMSPTFLIVRSYHVGIGIKKRRVYHMDAYRIKKDEELGPIQFFDMLAKPGAIVLIEWADLIQKHIPKHAQWFTFAHGEKKSIRHIVMGKK